MVIQANTADPYLDLFENFPNILVFGAGGYGHIPIPLIQGEIHRNLSMTAEFEVDVGFYGDPTHLYRPEIFGELARHTSGLITMIGLFPEWQDWISRTRFNLAPRGFGPTSFRIAEIVQLERIPVYIHSKGERWSAYDHSNISIDSIGFSEEIGSLDRLVEQLKHVTAEELAMKLERVKQARHFYTYEGVMDQLELFFKEPLVQSALSCQRVSRIYTLGFWWESFKFRLHCYWNPDYHRYCPQQLAILYARIP